MKELVKAARDVMVNEDKEISPKLKMLLDAGMIKEKKDLPFFRSALKKIRGGAIVTVQERTVLLDVLKDFLNMVDEAPEFFNLMRRELAKKKTDKKTDKKKTNEELDSDDVKTDEQFEKKLKNVKVKTPAADGSHAAIGDDIAREIEVKEEIEHNCATHIKHEEHGFGKVIWHDLSEAGTVNTIDVDFDTHICLGILMDEVEVVHEKHHSHKQEKGYMKTESNFDPSEFGFKSFKQWKSQKSELEEEDDSRNSSQRVRTPKQHQRDQYRKHENQNRHGAAAVYAHKTQHDSGDSSEVADGNTLKSINKRHDERGHITHQDSELRAKVSKKYTDRLFSK